MSLESENAQRIASPISSGRSSPSNFKLRQRDDDSILRKDKGYRRYASTIERVLAQFDTAVVEWADYISFLGRLLKALSGKPAAFTDIPHKTLVAKRLSQCLNPKLPSGVHQKTLEVYGFIFSSLGRSGLSRDLGLFLPGLSPVLSFASLSVKPNALSLFEAYLVRLEPESLRPALKSLILTLLPGLEEPNSEEYEWTLRILDILKVAVSRETSDLPQGRVSLRDQFFWQCMFLSAITSESRRAGALAYLIRNLPNLGSSQASDRPQANSTNGDHSQPTEEVLDQAIEDVASPEPGLLVRCFCAGLRDQHPLTQRGFLDLLVTKLPLGSMVLQKRASSRDLELLVAAATAVVVRRDMSLNRRLWSWFLGPEPPIEAAGATLNSPSAPRSPELMTPTQASAILQTLYFEKFGLGPLTNSIIAMIESDSESVVERTRPLRLCLSLMDRSEIGGLVLPRIFLPAMWSVYEHQALNKAQEPGNEVMKSASMFFDGVESRLIWAELIKVLSQAFQRGQNSEEATSKKLELVLFIISNFNIREEEMQIVHMPLVSLFLLCRLNTYYRERNGNVALNEDNVVHCSLKILNRLLELIPQRAISSPSDTKEEDAENDDDLSLSNEDIARTIEADYADSKIDLGSKFSPSVLGSRLLGDIFDLLPKFLASDNKEAFAELDLAVVVLGQIVRKTPRSSPRIENLLTVYGHDIRNWDYTTTNDMPYFPKTVAKLSALEAILSTPHTAALIPAQFIRQLLPLMATEIWPALSTSISKYNVEAVHCIWRLQALAPDDRLIESAIVTLMISPPEEESSVLLALENVRRFTVLWTHSPSVSPKSHSRRTSLARGTPTADRWGDRILDLPILERPLLHILDVLEEPRSPIFTFVANWLQSLQSLHPYVGWPRNELELMIPRITKVLLKRLTTLDLIKKILSTDDNSQGLQLQRPDIGSSVTDDAELVLYFLQKILLVAQCSTSNVWVALAEPSSAALLSELENDDLPSQADILCSICLRLLQNRSMLPQGQADLRIKLGQTCLSLIQQIMSGPLYTLIREKELETKLLEELMRSIHESEISLQVALMEVLLTLFKLAPSQGSSASPKTGSLSNREGSHNIADLTLKLNVPERRNFQDVSSQLPSRLLNCLMTGLTSPKTRPTLDSWISFLIQCLPLYQQGIFQILLRLVGSFCETLDFVLDSLQSAFQAAEIPSAEVSDPTIAILLTGLEQTLAIAHDSLISDDVGMAPVKTPETQQTGFFGTMVSGVFTSDANRSKTATANKRLTVLLCFKDAIRVCYSLWSWGDTEQVMTRTTGPASASLKYMSVRLRNRTKRIFEHLFAAEALECLETTVELWQSFLVGKQPSRHESIFDLLYELESSKPKITIPAIFNAIYSRTSPSMLEPSRKSTLTSEIPDTSLAAFLVAYTRSLDDDAMDEIWGDCLTFLKDVLANPMPHRQALAKLLEFIAVLGEKVDKTKFGEQRKMRRELGDLFNRLLAASLTIRPVGFSLDNTAPTLSEKSFSQEGGLRSSVEIREALGTEGLVAVLAAITPKLSKVLVETDRIVSTANTISTQVVGPIIRSKAFPENIDQKVLALLASLTSIPEASKAWKKEVAEAFNDSKFFATRTELAETWWFPVLRSWVLGDKERMPDLLSRLTAPAAAGIVFGVGATSARLEADRRAQLNLRRIAVLILASAENTFTIDLSILQEKIVDLLSATAASSPSSITRAEIYMVLRALILKTSSTDLSSIWPMINSELHDTLSSVYPSQSGDPPKPTCILQACKLLDTLITLNLDDFQMQQWLFISDTTDAVYGPTGSSTFALVDELADGLDSVVADITSSNALASDSEKEKRQPMLRFSLIKSIPEKEILEKVVRPFFGQLSIHAFESTFSMRTPDWKACHDELVNDLFNDSTLV